MTRDDWLDNFLDEVVRVRPTLALQKDDAKQQRRVSDGGCDE